MRTIYATKIVHVVKKAVRKRTSYKQIYTYIICISIKSSLCNLNIIFLSNFSFLLDPIRIKIDYLKLVVLYWSSISFYVVWNSLIMLGLCDFCIKTFLVTKFSCLHMTQMNNACCTFYETYYLSSIVEPWISYTLNISVA